MFKLVVLSVLLAAAVAEPGVLVTSNTYTETIPTPVATTYVRSSGGYIPEPVVYSSLSYPHFIKKRAAQFYGSYVAPSTYVAGALATPYASTYIAPAAIAGTYSSALLPYAAPAHFIKKRSAALLAAPASYIAPAPIASTYVASSPIASTYVASAPLATIYSSAILPGASYYPTYSALPFIKK